MVRKFNGIGHAAGSRGPYPWRYVATIVTAGLIAVAIVGGLSSSPGDVECSFEGSGSGALPDQVFDVPVDLPDISDHSFDGPASVVYVGPALRTGWLGGTETVPIVVGAECGKALAVRALGEISLHDLYDVRVRRPVLSPDGALLAVDRRWGGVHDDQSPEIRVVDLASGEVVVHQFPDQGLGGGVAGLTWTPDGQRIVATLVITTDRESGGKTSGSTIVLDVESGVWSERTHNRPLAFSPDGLYEARTANSAAGEGPELVVARNDGGLVSELDTESWATWGVSFSPDSRRIALVAAESTGPGTHHWKVVVFDASTGDRAEVVELGEHVGARLIGWGESGLLVDLELSDGGHQTVRLRQVNGQWDHGDVVVAAAENTSSIRKLSVAQDYLDADARAAQPPSFQDGDSRVVVNWLLLAATVTALIFWSRRLAVPAELSIATVDIYGNRRRRVRPRNGRAVGGLVLGVIGIPLGLIPLTFVLAGLCGVAGALLSFSGRMRARRGAPHGRVALAGIIASLIAVTLATLGGWSVFEMVRDL